MAAIVDESKCTACSACIEACPCNAITVEDVAKIDEEGCSDCGACVGSCPTEAITCG